MCLAASYVIQEQTKRHHAALPAQQSLTDDGQCSHSLPPALAHQQSSQHGAQIDPLPELAGLNHHKQGSAEQGSMPQGSMLQGCMPQHSSNHNAKQGSHRQGSQKRDSPTQQSSPSKGSFDQCNSRQGNFTKGSCNQSSSKQGSHSMEAMQALDLASIMGAPAEMLAPLLDLVEPLAKQEHQASLAQQNNHSLHPTQQSSVTHQADPLSPQQNDGMQHNQQASPQQSSCQANSAAQPSPGRVNEQAWHACVHCSCHADIASALALQVRMFICLRTTNLQHIHSRQTQ